MAINRETHTEVRPELYRDFVRELKPSTILRVINEGWVYSGGINDGMARVNPVTHCCIVGDILLLESGLDPLYGNWDIEKRLPFPCEAVAIITREGQAYSYEESQRRRNIETAARRLEEANDDGILNTPDSVRKALGR